MTYRTARNYMDVVEVFGQRKVDDCESLSQSFTAEALYYLSRDTVIEDAVKDAIELAKGGERITLA